MLYYRKGVCFGINQVENYFKSIRQRVFDKSNHHKYKIGAMILKGSRVISIGWNDIDKTHPYMCKLHEHKKQHAEHNAINRARHKHCLKGSTIVVYGENRFGDSIISKPCQYCQEILRSYGIKKVIYSTESGYKSFKI